MEKRAFFIALGVPRGVEPETIHVAYRRVLTRYRRELEDYLDEPTQPPGRFSVMRTYSERRHAALLEEPDPEPLLPGRGRPTEVDRFFDGYIPEPLVPPKARREGKDLFVELRLTAGEASRGGLFPVHIPVLRRCPSCRDRDEEQRLSCSNCHGKGRVLEDRMVEVTSPPGVNDGQTARVAMDDVGLEHTDLIVRVIVGTDLL